MALPAPDADIDRDVDLAARHVLGDRGLVDSRGTGPPSAAIRTPPTEIASRSRSAFSPALPTAMTMRPQLASPAASAVLTSGELPIGKPDPPRRAVALGAGHVDRDEFLGALAVARDLLARGRS